MLSISEDHISYITDTQSVYQDRTDGYPSGNFRLFLADFQYISGREDENIVLADTKALCNLRLCFQMLVFTMDRNCILRMDQGIDQFDLFLAGMSGYMGILENNICALT